MCEMTYKNFAEVNAYSSTITCQPKECDCSKLLSDVSLKPMCVLHSMVVWEIILFWQDQLPYLEKLWENCSIGEYLTLNCGDNPYFTFDQESIAKCVSCTVGFDVGTVQFLSKGGQFTDCFWLFFFFLSFFVCIGIEENSCEYQCQDGFYYDPFRTYKCLPCTQCDLGEIIVEDCKSEITTASLSTNNDVLCRQCLLGQEANEAQTACISCALGKYNNQYGGFCRDCAQQAQYTPSTGSITCQRCANGKIRDSSQKDECVSCDDGKYRLEEMNDCNNCPPGTSSTGGDYCDFCEDGKYANEAGSTTCLSCSGGQYTLPRTLNGDLTTYPHIQYIGSTACYECFWGDNTPDSETTDFLPDCKLQCKVGHYFDLLQGRCLTCQLPCKAGNYRLAGCNDAGSTILPACQACIVSDQMASLVFADAVENEHYKFVVSEQHDVCKVECLPGFNQNNLCNECSIPGFDASKQEFVNQYCEWICKKGFHLTGSTCEACQNITHPRTLSDAETLDYFASLDKIDQLYYANFSICRDYEEKVWGILVEWAENGPNCGNGVLEKNLGEVCDDGNFEDGDGCASDCKTIADFYDCEVIGEKCKENCGLNVKPNEYLTSKTCETGLFLFFRFFVA